MDVVSGIPETSRRVSGVQAFDWAATGLGPAGAWPQSLKSAAGLVLQATFPMLLLWGEDAYVIYNDAYAALAGIEPPGQLGRKYREAWPRLAEFARQLMRTVLAGGTVEHHDAPLNIAYSPVPDASGRPAGALGIATRAAAPRDSDATLITKFFENSPEKYAIFTRDAAGAFRYEAVNEGALQIYQLSRPQVTGRRVEEVLAPEAAQIVNSSLAACLTDGRRRRYQRRQGDIVLEAVAMPMPADPNGPVRVLVSAHDISVEAAKTEFLQAINQQLAEMATTDALTQINNRRGFDETLEREWSRAQRLGTGVALLMFDIDSFKSFNDQFGHLKGDECLQRIAACLRDNLGRGTDFVARYGGEEFGVLLADVQRGHNGPLIVAERLRLAVERLAIANPASSLGVVTISCGVAIAWPQPAPRGSIEASSISLIREADAALYTAKYSGRNRIYGQGVTRAGLAEPPEAAPVVRRGRGRPRKAAAPPVPATGG